MAKGVPSKLLTQEKWGRLTLLGFSHTKVWPSGQSRPFCQFKCDCGSEVVTDPYSVMNGKTQSCGCYAREVMGKANLRHGFAKKGNFSPEYRAWRDMLTRGRNERRPTAHHYVGRGITVCDEWLPGGDGKGFERFLAHVGPKPDASMSLDRIENNRGYEPGNVRWATQEMQAQNTRRNRLVEYQGTPVPIAVAARRSGMKASVIRDRIRLGWPTERLFGPRARSEFGKGPKSRPGVQPRA